MDVCRECGTALRVRHGLCRDCRRQLIANGKKPLAAERKGHDNEPPHSRPWVHRLGG